MSGWSPCAPSARRPDCRPGWAASPPAPDPDLGIRAGNWHCHQQITEQLGTNVFLCDAHSPWQRGSNENLNGLLRDYFPKGTDLRQADPERPAQATPGDHARPSAGHGRSTCSPSTPPPRAPRPE